MKYTTHVVVSKNRCFTGEPHTRSDDTEQARAEGLDLELDVENDFIEEVTREVAPPLNPVLTVLNLI